MYYVYIIKSVKDGTLYKGFTENYLKRLEQHNAGESRYTSIKLPWILIFVQKFETKKEALIKEKKLKKANTDYLLWLVDQDFNLLKK